jgi:hypothetical protein
MVMMMMMMMIMMMMMMRRRRRRMRMTMMTMMTHEDIGREGLRPLDRAEERAGDVATGKALHLDRCLGHDGHGHAIGPHPHHRPHKHLPTQAARDSDRIEGV